MAEIRTLNVPMRLIERAATDPDYCKALALTLMLRAKFPNSQFPCFGIEKLRRELHVGFYNLRETLSRAVDENLLGFVEYTTKEGKPSRALKTMKMKKAMSFVRFHLCESRHGVKIFMKSKLQGNVGRYRRNGRRQRLADVADQIRLAKIVSLVRRYEKRYGQKLANEMKAKFNVTLGKQTSHSAMRRYAAMCRPRTVGTESMLNTGYSHESIRRNFSGLSLYKVGKLVRLAVADRLIRAERNYMCVDYVRDAGDHNHQAATGCQNISSYFRGRTPIVLGKRAFKAKARIVEDGAMALRNVWMMRMANSYFVCCDALKRTEGKKRRKPKATAEATIANDNGTLAV